MPKLFAALVLAAAHLYLALPTATAGEPPATAPLVANGDFETDADRDGRPDGWPKLKAGGSYPTEAGNRFLRLHSPEPDTIEMLYREIGIPAGVAAIELAWRQRITDLKPGARMWYDARIMMEFMDAERRKVSPNPSAPYSRKSIPEWQEKTVRFLVPEGATTFKFMPCLFNVEAGTFDLDDIRLTAADPEPLQAAREARRKMAEARHVPPEEPEPDSWPKMLRVVGNRLRDADGNEVWLQGVNTGNLETLPNDKQVIKSAVVAVEEWKANCIRVPMKESFWYGRSDYQNDGGGEYRATIDRIVKLAANRGAYVVLDLHRFRAPRQEHADFWTDAATHFKDHPAVLFDLFNEPHGVSWEIWRNGGWIGEKQDRDEAAFLSAEQKRKAQGFESVGMQGLVDAVRATGAKNVVIAGGIFYCNDLTGIVDGYALEEKGGNGIMYSWHTYNWHPGWERVLPVAEKHPVFLGEVGADIKKMHFVPEESQESPFTWVPDMLGFIQKHGIHWTGWCLHPQASPRMIVDWTYEPTPFWGAFAKRALAGAKFELKRLR